MRNRSEGRSRDPRVGRLAVCRHGKIGLILAREETPDGPVYCGVRWDGRQWQSRAPRLIGQEDSRPLVAHFAGVAEPVREFLRGEGWDV